MPIYRLIHKPIFPPPKLAEPDGLLAVGGDLAPERLIAAYQQGVFPWYSPGDPILWWSPDPRLILEPAKIHVSKSLRKIILQHRFDVRFDFDFSAVIAHCARIPRKEGTGTWITPEMKAAYIQLHQLGLAHSVECWQNEKLAGGLYGVSLGRCFFGESMFAKVANASKVALVALAHMLQEWNFLMIDCQVTTHHLVRMGASEISRNEFLKRLQNGLQYPTLKESWNDVEWNPEAYLRKSSG